MFIKINNVLVNLANVDVVVLGNNTLTINNKWQYKVDDQTMDKVKKQIAIHNAGQTDTCDDKAMDIYKELFEEDCGGE